MHTAAVLTTWSELVLLQRVDRLRNRCLCAAGRAFFQQWRRWQRARVAFAALCAAVDTAETRSCMHTWRMRSLSARAAGHAARALCKRHVRQWYRCTIASAKRRQRLGEVAFRAHRRALAQRSVRRWQESVDLCCRARRAREAALSTLGAAVDGRRLCQSWHTWRVFAQNERQLACLQRLVESQVVRAGFHRWRVAVMECRWWQRREVEAVQYCERRRQRVALYYWWSYSCSSNWRTKKPFPLSPGQTT